MSKVGVPHFIFSQICLLLRSHEVGVRSSASTYNCRCGYQLSFANKTKITQFFFLVDRRNGKVIINSHTSGGTGVRTPIVILPVELGLLDKIAQL